MLFYVETNEKNRTEWATQQIHSPDVQYKVVPMSLGALPKQTHTHQSVLMGIQMMDKLASTSMNNKWVTNSYNYRKAQFCVYFSLFPNGLFVSNSKQR